MWSFFSRDPTKDFPYEIGEPINYFSDRNYWTLHKGLKKGSSEPVTIFILDARNSAPAVLDAAKSAIKRLKTLRHPSILTYVDSVESDKAIYLATEYVEPLGLYLERKQNRQSDLSVAWGLFQVTRALSFLNNDGSLRHNNVHMGSVFVNSAGEWKLGGVDFVTNSDSSFVYGKVPSLLSEFDPPESRGGGKVATKWSVDSWGLGCLIWEVFNCPIKEVSQLKNAQNIPKNLAGQIYKELVNPNGASRPNPADIIAKGRKSGGYFKNDLVDTLLFLEEIQIKEQSEKVRFFSGLPTVLDKFPEDICRHKILPQLITAFEFGNAGSSVLVPLFKLGKLLEEPEYQTKIVPCVVKLFSSTDRVTRVKLLQQLDNFGDHLQPGTVNDKIFPNVITGFTDTSPVVREQTVKAMLYLAPKLNYNNLNVELLKHFARLQVKDDQGGIRTNTTICLGKIACHLNPQTRRKILIPAFTRVFQDSFPQAKIAGILGLAATQQYYLLNEISGRILPALCILTTDQDKSVRENAFKTIKGFLGKLEKVSDDPSLQQKYEADVDASTPSAVDSASTWAGWAVSALTSKFNRSQSSHSVTNQSGQIQGVGRSKGRYTFGTQSSSSTSTTTSSIPSTPSDNRDVLQPAVEGQESATDYDDDWDNEDWGSIEGDAAAKSIKNADSSSSNFVPNTNSKKSDGWDTWAIDEAEESVGDGWGDFSLDGTSNSHGEKDSKSCQDNFFSNVKNSLEKPGFDDIQNSVNNVNDSFESLSVSNDDKLEEMRKRREERKLHRQNELQTKRSSKSGPMKLGAKKIDIDLLQ